MRAEGRTRRRLGTDRSWRALGLIGGPAAFIGAWVVGGSSTPGYSAVNDAISRIAAVGAPNRNLMTAGFVAYGVSVTIGSTALRSSPLSRGWTLAAINGVATLGVAALPLDHSASMDTWHGVAAGIGYASITVLPIVTAGPLRRLGHERAATLSIVAGAASGLCLVATTLTDANGLFQRAGLTVGDVWLVATGIALYRGRLRAPA